MKPAPRLTRSAVSVLIVALGCSKPSPAPAPAPPPAASPPGHDAPSAAASASPVPTAAATAPPLPETAPPPSAPGPAPIPVRSAVAIVDGVEVVLDPTASTKVDPRATFRLEVGSALADGRLSLRDEQDAMVPSAGTTELGPSWTRFQLTPDAPLVAGSAYTLHVDGNASHAPHDGSGQALQPLVLHLRTSGERPPVRRKRRDARR